MFVSVIIITHNKSKFLELTLSAFLLQSKKEFELVIVNDGSTDETRKVVDYFKDRLNIKYIFQKNKGRAAARNAGMKAAKHSCIIFNDDDRIPSIQFIEEHLRIHESNIDNNIVVIGSKFDIITSIQSNVRVYLREILEILSKNFEEVGSVHGRNEMLFGSSDIINDFESIIKKWAISLSWDNSTYIIDEYGELLNDFYFPWAICSTGNMSFSRKANFDNEFDEKIIGWGMEDTDFSYQLFLNNFKFIYARNAMNYHQVHERASEENNQLISNIKYFCDKYKSLECYLFSQTFNSIITPPKKLVKVNNIYKELLNSSIDLKGNYIDIYKKIGM